MKQAVIIMSSFAALWWIWGVSALSPAPLLALAPCLIAAGLIAAALRLPKLPRSEAAGRAIAWSSAAEGTAILVAWNVLVWTHATGYFANAVVIIVGLHFLPIARALRFRPYAIQAAMLAGTGLCTAAIARPEPRLLATGCAAAVILWTGSALVLHRARQTAARQPGSAIPGMAA